MTVAVTFTETVKVEGATYTVDDSPYDLADNLAARFIHRGWATGTISGTVSVTMSAAYKSGGVSYAQGETYEIAQPLAGFLISEGKATPATVPDVAPSNVAIPITVTQPSVSDPAAQSVLFEFSIDNDSESNASANTYARPIYIEFQKGDIPADQYPVFRTKDNATEIPYGYHFKKTHDDGSWLGASFMLLVPEAINASQSLACECLNGGAAPASSSRDRTDGTADIKLEADLVYPVSQAGTYTSSCEDGSMLFSEEAPGSGGITRYFKDRCPYRDGSNNPHGQLFADHYRIVLEDHEGGFYGILHVARTMQAYFDVNSPTRDARAFSAIRLKDGSTTIRTQAATDTITSRTFTVDTTNDRLTFSGPTGFKGLSHFMVSSDGTLPTGLDDEQLYQSNIVNSTTATALIGGISTANITDEGSGTHTMTPVIAISQFTSFFSWGTDSELDFFQAGGSGAAPVCTVKKDPVYARAVRLVPPIDLTETSWGDADIDYYPDTCGFLFSYEPSTSDDEDRGMWPMHYAFMGHFAKQDTFQRKRARVVGGMAAHRDLACYDSTTNRIPVGNNGSYTGMGTARPTWRFCPPEVFTNFPYASADQNNLNQRKGATFFMDAAHFAILAGYPFAAFGEWQYLDLTYEQMNTGVMRFARGVVGGTTYHGVSAASNQNRATGRLLMSAMWAGLVVPDDAVERPYVDDIWDQHWEYHWDRINNDSSNFNDYLRSIGHYTEDNSGSGLGGFMTTVLMAAFGAFGGSHRATEESLAVLNYVAKFVVYRGSFHASSYRHRFRKGGSNSALCDETYPVMFMADGFNWAADTDRITDTLSRFTGDGTLISVGYEDGYAIPGGMEQHTLHYTVQASGNTFKLSKTEGGAAIDLTNNGTNEPFSIYTPNPATNAFIGTAAYHMNSVAAGSLILAGGATVEGLAETVAALKAVAAANGMSNGAMAYAESY